MPVLTPDEWWRITTTRPDHPAGQAPPATDNFAHVIAGRRRRREEAEAEIRRWDESSERNAKLWWVTPLGLAIFAAIMAAAIHFGGAAR